jgi:uncharacterized protein YdgA (DUF945 family)
MKKILVSIAAVAIVYCGLAYLSGYFAEKISREQLALMLTQPEMARTDIKISEYRRGIFSSNFVLSMTMPDELPEIGRLEIIGDTRLRHGPLLFADGIKIGPFSSVSTVRIKTSTPELDQKIAAIFGPSVGLITSTTYFNGGYDARWTLPALEHKADATTFSIADSELTYDGNYRSLDANYRFALGRIEVTGVDGSKMTITPLVGSANSRNIEAGVGLVDMDMSIDQIDVQNPSKPPVMLKALGLKQKQVLNGENVDSSVTFSLAKLTGPVVLDNFHYTMAFNGISKQALKRLSELTANAPVDPAQRSAYYSTQFKELAPVLLQNGLAIKLDTGAQYLGANPQAQWLVQYKAPADGSDVRTITDPLEYLRLVDSTLLARLPSSLIPEPLVAPYIDSHITRDGNDYVLRATLVNGDLTIGKTAVPKEVLAALFAKMKAQQSAAEQRPPALTRAP